MFSICFRLQKILIIFATLLYISVDKHIKAYTKEGKRESAALVER